MSLTTYTKQEEKIHPGNLLRTKRFLIFAGIDYYPIGGAHDYHGRQFDTHGEAIAYCIKEIRENEDVEWIHAFDCEKKKIILSLSETDNLDALFQDD